MGLLKKGASTLWSATTAPTRLVFPRAVTKQHNATVKTLKTSHAPYCPNCARSRLFKSTLDYSDLEDSISVWLCNTCDFKAEVYGDSISDLKYWLQENAREVYENSFLYEQMQSNEDYAVEARQQKIKKRVYMARFFLILGLLFLPLAILGILKLNFFLALNSMLVGFCMAFMGAVNGYRAWQIHTNSFFAKDGKAQFNEWLTTTNWFAFPVTDDD